MFWRPFFFLLFGGGDRLKKILNPFFIEKNFSRPLFWKTLAPEFLALSSSVPVLDLERAVLGRAVVGLGFFCILSLGLEPCVLDTTSD